MGWCGWCCGYDVDTANRANATGRPKRDRSVNKRQRAARRRARR